MSYNYKMTFGQFIGQVKAGKGMAAIARESNRLGVRKIENGLRIGVSIAKAVPQLRSAATAVGKGLDTLDSAAGSAKKLGNTLEATQRAVKSGDVAGAVNAGASAYSQAKAGGARLRGPLR